MRPLMLRLQALEKSHQGQAQVSSSSSHEHTALPIGVDLSSQQMLAKLEKENQLLKAKTAHLPVQVIELEVNIGRRDPLAYFAVDSETNIYTVHRGVASVEVYSPTGTLRQTMGPVGLEPRGIAVSANGCIYALDASGSIQVFSAQGGLLHTMRPTDQPRGITLDGQGNLYLAGHATGIKELDRSGHAHRVLGVPGDSVAVDKDGNICTLLRDDGRAGPTITVFDAQGSKQRSFGRGSGDGSSGKGVLASDASSIAVDSKGNIAVVEPHQQRVQVFDPQGALVRVLGGKSQARHVPGLFVHPQAVFIDAEDNLYVLDTARRHVFVFSF